jgi:metal-sulfur cluster biosynthetic enzyme
MSRLSGTATHTSGYTGTCASVGSDCDGDSQADSKVCADYKYNNNGTVENRHSCDLCDATGTLPAAATARQAFSVFFFTDVCAAKAIDDSAAPLNYALWDALGAQNAYSSDGYLCSKGHDVMIENWAGKNHSKVGVFDNSILIGSMNWSANGDQGNDEQSLIIHDATLATQVYNEIAADVGKLVTAGVTECTQQSTEVCTDGSDNNYNGLIDYCDAACACATPATDCLSCNDAPTGGGTEETGAGGGVVDCNVTPTDPECSGTGPVVPAGYSCDTVCVDSRDGSCYCQSSNSNGDCYDASCDPTKATLSCSSTGTGTYKCASTGQVDTSLLRNATVAFRTVKGVTSEVHTNTKWYAMDATGVVYEEFWCESPHPYTNNCGYGESGCVNDAMYFCSAYKSNAQKIALWFASIDTEACECNGGGNCVSGGGYTCVYDYLDLKNSSNTHVAYYGGPFTANTYLYGWSTWVTGTTANLYFDTDSAVADWGFAVSAVAYEPPAATGGSTPTTCVKVKGVYQCN